MMAAPKEFSQLQIALVAILVLAFLMFISARQLQPQIANPTFTIREAGLIKSVPLGISPGESYTYEYGVENGSVNLSYVVMGGSGCTMVSSVEGQVSVCLDKNGNDQTGQNTSYDVPAIILTTPWMLAVGDGWHWNVSSYLIFQDYAKLISDTNYSVVRKEYYRGREAYVVKIVSSEEGGGTIMDWVDAEKRVLLKEAGLGYEVDLVAGLPFNGSS
jgi:hypothetical protein